MNPENLKEPYVTEPTDSPRIVRMIDKLVPWVQEAVERHAHQDRVVWDAFPQMFPSPANQGLITGLGVYLEIPGAVMNTAVQTSLMLQPNGATQDTIDEAVRETMEQLRKARSQQIASMEEQQTMAARNGNSSPASGLILPGQH